jgi:uncharacterized protein (TIGR03437 family)
VISTVAGNGTNATAGDGGPATSASLRPGGLALDGAGNIYIADPAKSVIRKVNTAGIITTVAGNGNGSTAFSGDGGPATSASIYIIPSNHNGIAVDGAGNLYIADDGHNRVRKVDTAGIITTVAGTGTLGFSGDGGPAKNAMLWRPNAVAVDGAGNLYIADADNFRIRKVDTAGVITTVAGNGAIGSSGDGGLAINAALFEIRGVAVDGAGNIYISDQAAKSVRKVNAAGIISTVAGNGTLGFSGDGGPATSAAFNAPYNTAVDGAGNLYIADFGNRRVRKVDTAGIIRSIAGGGGSAANIGDGGPPTSALLDPTDVAVDSAGNLYIADVATNRVRKITIGARVPGLSVSASALYFSAIAGGNTPAPQMVTVSTAGVVPLSFAVSASTASGGNWLSAGMSTGLTPAQLTVSISSAVAAGSYKGTIVLTPTAPDLPPISIPVTLNVTATGPARPGVSASGVVNGASFQPGVVANSWATIQGTNLASTTTDWNSVIGSGQLPTSLGGVTVTFGARPAYLAYISPTQINLLVPDVSPGTVPVLVTNSGATNSPINAPLNRYGPAFFLWPGNQVVATRQDFSVAVKPGTFAGAQTVAAKPGDVLILWGTGFGPTTPAAPPGVPVPGDNTYSTSTMPTIMINNLPATVYGAALAPGYAGLYQVAIQAPASPADGDWPVMANIGGVASATGMVLAIRR